MFALISFSDFSSLMHGESEVCGLLPYVATEVLYSTLPLALYSTPLYPLLYDGMVSAL